VPSKFARVERGLAVIASLFGYHPPRTILGQNDLVTDGVGKLSILVMFPPRYSRAMEYCIVGGALHSEVFIQEGCFFRGAIQHRIHIIVFL